MLPIEIQDSLMYLDGSDLSMMLRRDGIFDRPETELIKSLLKKDDIAIDVGAHIGYFTLLMARRCRRVFAFEPERNNYTTLIRNMRINNLHNVIPSPYAVAEQAGAVTLCRHWTNTGMNRIYCTNWCVRDHQTAVTIKLDQLIDIADFIKMDCEGSEYGALKGMKNLLINNDIKMVMEFHSPSIIEYGAKPEDIFNFMNDLGYEMRLIGYPDNLSFKEIVSISSDPVGGYNLYCSKK
jgi:FkbM family methyltransferase